MTETKSFTDTEHYSSQDRNFKIYKTHEKVHNLDIIIVMVGKGLLYCGGLIVIDCKTSKVITNQLTVPSNPSV